MTFGNTYLNFLTLKEDKGMLEKAPRENMGSVCLNLNSAIPQMQRLLNVDKKKEINALNQLNIPVNNDSCKSISLRQ